MRKFYGKNTDAIKYLKKRKRKRKEFKKRLNAYDYSQYEFDSSKLKENEKPVDKFSDEEYSDDEYNYYTDSDEE